MKNIDKATQKRLMNITAISLTLGLHRHTVRRHIQVGSIMPLIRIKGILQYDFAEVAKVIYGPRETKRFVGKDIADMTPKEALKHYTAELARLEFGEKSAQYCRVDEVRKSWEQIRSSLIGVLKSFPGSIELKDDATKEALPLITELCKSSISMLADTSGIPQSVGGK